MAKIEINACEETIKQMPEIVKLMKTADTLEFSLENGIVDGPSEDGWKTNIHDGNRTITIHMYHRKHDMRLK